MADEKTNEMNGSTCCGGPAAKPSEACCVTDATAKAEGKGGCGCATTLVSEKAPVAVAVVACCG